MTYILLATADFASKLFPGTDSIIVSICAFFHLDDEFEFHVLTLSQIV